MSNVKQNNLVMILITLLVITGLTLQGCYGAIPPGGKGNPNKPRNVKSEEDIEAEKAALKELIETTPDLVAEETYTESESAEMDLLIAVVSMIEEEENKDIYLLDETGVAPRRLTSFASVESFPCLTDDGKRVFFISDMDGQEQINPFQIFTEIYFINVDTEAVTRLTYDNRMDYGLSVSGDASKIVYMTQEMGQDGYENPQMILMDGEGKNQEVIQDEALKNCIPKMSGDGNYIVFNSYRHGSMDIFLMDIKNSKKYKTTNLTNSITSDYFPAINHDGSVIVYEKLLKGVQDESMYELFRIDRNGKNDTALTNDKFCDSFPTITSDGSKIIFVSKRWDWDDDGHYDEALFIMNSDGTDLRKISKDPEYFDQPDV